VRLPAAARDLRSRCAAHALTLPATAVFSHVTAARALGLPLPLAKENDDAIHVTVPKGVRAPRRRDVIGHQRRLEEDELILAGDLRITSPARTFVDLADMLDVVALVAVGDRLLWRERPRCARETLAAAVARMGASRGSRRAARALALLDDGAQSPKETELRLVLQEAGFGPFATNFELLDPMGSFVARVDLALAELRIAIEYEGDHHRDPVQWRKDIARRRRIEALGWIYLPVTQADLDDPRRLIADLSAALVRRH
jgi:very-short-patch-repair endonuclease